MRPRNTGLDFPPETHIYKEEMLGFLCLGKRGKTINNCWVFWVLISYATSFSLCDIIYLMRHHLPYATSFERIWFIFPEIFWTQIKNWYIKIFSLPTHPHSKHFPYKYQNFSRFYFPYMVHKPHTFQVLTKLVYGL